MPTKWILAALVLGGVVVVAAIVLLAAIRDGDGSTVAVETTTTEAPPVDTTAVEPVDPDEPPVRETQLQVQAGGRQRSALVIEPAAAADGVRRPVVVVLHGLGVSAEGISRAADWRGAVASDGFVGVFPQGVENSWNLGPCCPPANLVNVADRPFLETLIEQLRARDDVDPDRIYLTGFSNGALMTYWMACQRPDLIAAIAPMAGTNLTGCSPDQPVPLLHQHGDVDLVVPYGGGVALGSLVSAAPFPPVEGSVADWAAASGCAEPPARRADGPVERTSWSGCGENGRVELVKVLGKGHDWLTSGGYDPLDELLRFFSLR